MYELWAFNYHLDEYSLACLASIRRYAWMVAMQAEATRSSIQFARLQLAARSDNSYLWAA